MELGLVSLPADRTQVRVVVKYYLKYLEVGKRISVLAYHWQPEKRSLPVGKARRCPKIQLYDTQIAPQWPENQVPRPPAASSWNQTTQDGSWLPRESPHAWSDLVGSTHPRRIVLLRPLLPLGQCPPPPLRSRQKWRSLKRLPPNWVPQLRL